MKLSRLLKSVSHLSKGITSPQGSSFDPEITSVHYNSKDVKTGGLFVAIKGLTADGHNYIEDAVKRGAIAVIAETALTIANADVCIVTDSRKALAAVASEFYRNPSSGMHIIGITGTNGKTTTSYLIESILVHEGFKPGVIGTVNYRYGNHEFPNPMTTPESLDLQRILFEMKKNGVTHVVMEISSHAIDLERVYNCSVDTAVFTNLTQDHLDYHKTMDAYWDCKKRLFTEFLPRSEKRDSLSAVINCGNRYGKELRDLIDYRVLSFGDNDSEIKAMDTVITINGINACINTPKGDLEITTPAIGVHNLENILNAVGATIAAGASLTSIKSGIEKFNVPGRLEKIENGKGVAVFVDYAHTPDALENVLKTIEPLTPGRVICVFGCGGDRDNSKRSIMGSIAEKYSNLAIVTSDNPRTELPENIIEGVLGGMSTALFNKGPEAFKLENGIRNHRVEIDRHKAILYAISASQSGDSVLIAGKGHETYQITNTGTIDFDDREEAREAFKQND